MGDRQVNIAQQFDTAWRKGLVPDPAISVTQWADAYRMLPASAAEPGKWQPGVLKDASDAMGGALMRQRVCLSGKSTGDIV